MVHPATLEDVARAAGVSRQTVSNVLNSPAVVRPATRERVERAIADLGYRPHVAARQLRTRRSSTIGIHLNPYAGGISGVVLDRFVHALADQAGTRGMRILAYSSHDVDDEIRQLGQLFDSGEVDAVVITGTVHDDPRTDWLTARELPFVSFGRPWQATGKTAAAHRWVDVDGAAGTAEATTYCLRSGAREVVFLGWPQGSGQGDERERGWREVMGEAGLGQTSLRVAEDLRLAQGTVSDYLDRGEPIEAVVCASDTLAIGAHLALAAHGLSDVPVIGFDNTPVAEALGLSSVEQNPELAAAGVLTLLMGDSRAVLPGAATPSDHLLITPQLVVR